MSVGKKVRKWRNDRGLSERAAAELAGVSQPTWRAVESDDTKRIGLDVAYRFVKALGGAISLDDFVRGRRRSIPPAA
jgi:transcriptional regulator with XRE-family HTH domain